MAQNVAYNDEWIPTIILSDAVEYLMRKLLAGRVGLLSFRDEVSKKEGETIEIPTLGTLTGRTKIKDEDYGTDTPDGSKITFGTLKILHCTFRVEESLNMALRMGVINSRIQKYFEKAMNTLGQLIDSNMFALYASCSNSTTQAATLTDTVLLSAWLKMKLTPEDDRVIVLSPDVYADLLDRTVNPDYSRADALGEAGIKNLIDGALGKIRSFQTFMSNGINITSGSPNVHHNMAFNQGALGMVSVPQDLNCGPGVETARVNHQDISMRLRNWYEPKEGKWYHSFEVLAAVGLADPDRSCYIPITRTS